MEFIDNKEWIPVHTLPGFECCIEYYVNKQGELKVPKVLLNVYLNRRLVKAGIRVSI